MRRNETRLAAKLCFLCLMVGIIGGCAYGQSERIGTGKYEVRAGGLGYEEKWKEEARKVCPTGYAVVERGKCDSGDTCLRGTVKCD